MFHATIYIFLNIYFQDLITGPYLFNIMYVSCYNIYIYIYIFLNIYFQDLIRQ